MSLTKDAKRIAFQDFAVALVEVIRALCETKDELVETLEECSRVLAFAAQVAKTRGLERE